MAQAQTQTRPQQDSRRFQDNRQQERPEQSKALTLPEMKGALAKMEPEFAKALPAYIPSERFVRATQTALAFTRNIERVTNINSLMAACAKAAQDGLILDGREAALVVDYKGEVQYRPMMRGLLKLAYNSGNINGIVVEVVRKGDVFRHSPTNLKEPIIHEIDHEGGRGDAFVVYALAELKDGGILHEVMSVSDINRIRDRSDAWKAFTEKKIKSTPWSTDWTEMARKTVFRRLSKYLPSSSDRDAFRQAVERIDEDFSFEADADQHGEISTPRPATKQRGGAAAALKNVTPQDAVPARNQGADDFDRDTGEIIEHEDPAYGMADMEMQPGDDL
ncbi:recombinase RecT [Rhizobium lentis]|uniref:recombinase RecT n=1 Tax=Rhizobium lentis TaxID=1138194 RepID=UPI001C83AFD6|nr:recombinase RecT [Rhizobium lentis]MBX5020437.1 recombinase RecT [Rhizobium lentis]